MFLLLLLHAYGEFGIKSKNDERWRLRRRKIRVFAPCLCGAASVSPLLTAIVVEEEQFILVFFLFLPPRKGKEPEKPCLFTSFNFLLLFKFALAHQQQQSASEREKREENERILTFNFNFLFWLLQTEYFSLYLQRVYFWMNCHVLLARFTARLCIYSPLLLLRPSSEVM